MRTIFTCFLYVMVSVLGTPAHSQSIQIIPPAPRYLEPVYLRTNTGASTAVIYGAHVSMVDGSLVVDYDWNVFLGPPPPNGWMFDASLGSFPAGSYRVRANTPLGPLTAQFTVSPKIDRGSGTTPSVDFTGMWWNPQESGWGLSVFQGPTHQLFAVWFVYDASGAPTWYTLQPGAWDSPQSFSGPVYRTSGPYFGGLFDRSQVKIQHVGNGTISFTDSTHGHFGYSLDGQTMSTKAIEREPIE